MGKEMKQAAVIYSYFQKSELNSKEIGKAALFKTKAWLENI